MSYFGRIKQLFLSSSLLKDSVVYVFTDGVNKSIPFLLLPVISYYISPAEYGMITNYNLIVHANQYLSMNSTVRLVLEIAIHCLVIYQTYVLWIKRQNAIDIS